MPKKIAAIGVEIPVNDSTHIPLRSKTSLLDYDIAIIDPNIWKFYGSYDDYLGKPCLNDSLSFQLKEHTEHWKHEIVQASEAGKALFVLLNKFKEVYVATGEKSYSGTGRNRSTTRHVTSHNNYQVIPGSMPFRNANGKSMRLAGKDNVLARIIHHAA